MFVPCSSLRKKEEEEGGGLENFCSTERADVHHHRKKCVTMMSVQGVLAIVLLMLAGCASIRAQESNVATLEVLPIHEALGGAEVTYDPVTGQGVLSLLPPTSLVLLAERPERVVIPVNVSDEGELSSYIQGWESGFSNATGGDPNAVLAGSSSDGTIYSLLVTLSPPSFFSFPSEAAGADLYSLEYPFALLSLASPSSEQGDFTGVTITSTASLIVDPTPVEQEWQQQPLQNIPSIQLP